jgi:hypothetical protein
LLKNKVEGDKIMKERAENTATKGKGKLAKKLIILAVSLAMAATTAISLAFWSNGIIKAEDEKNLSVTIGTGSAVPTILSFADAVDSSNDLIPQQITPSAGETNSLVFTIDVKWEADPDSEVGSDIDGAEGILTGYCTAIGTDLLEATALGGLPLFVVEFDETSYQIYANGAAVTVTATVKMNEPLDKDQYDLVAGQTLSITFAFEANPV